MICPLCGYHARPEEQRMACARCPLARGCGQPGEGLLCCPRCHYAWVEQSRVVNWFRKRLYSNPKAQTMPSADADAIPLGHLSDGEEATVAFVRTTRQAYEQRLSVLGVLPGCLLQLRQTSPALVIQVGETELALDRHAGQEIFVRRRP